MPSKASIVWSLREFAEVIKLRQANEYDVVIGVSGKRGEGKSTLLGKLFYRFKGFKPWKHQVYSREDVVKLLKEQTFGFCWDDEAINSGYKRDFMKKVQQILIKLITNYRDNLNIYASAIPFFYSLDKDLRELIVIHIHIIERGLAVILMQLEDNLHQTDPWDTKNNAKKEEKWQIQKARDPDFKFPYHRLSTFVGYLRFNDLTVKQKILYKEVKKKKRSREFMTDDERAEGKEEDTKDKIFKLMFDGKLTKRGLKEFCLIDGKKYSSMVSILNKKLNDIGEKRTLKQFLEPSGKEIRIEETGEEINKLIPAI